MAAPLPIHPPRPHPNAPLRLVSTPAPPLTRGRPPRTPIMRNPVRRGNAVTRGVRGSSTTTMAASAGRRFTSSLPHHCTTLIHRHAARRRGDFLRFLPPTLNYVNPTFAAFLFIHPTLRAISHIYNIFLQSQKFHAPFRRKKNIQIYFAMSKIIATFACVFFIVLD